MKALISKVSGRGNKGQATVEFALAAILFLGFLFIIFDVAMLFYVNLTMQHAVREGTRYAVTGRSDLGSDRRDALIQKIREQSWGLYDRNLHVPKEPTIKVITPGNVTFSNYTGGTTQAGNPGQAGETIVVSLIYSWRVLTPFLRPVFPGGVYTFTVKSTMKNEPFPGT